MTDRCGYVGARAVGSKGLFFATGRGVGCQTQEYFKKAPEPVCEEIATQYSPENVNIRLGEYGFTPLMAIIDKSRRLTKAHWPLLQDKMNQLLDLGADLSLRDGKGRNLLDIYEEAEYSDDDLKKHMRIWIAEHMLASLGDQGIEQEKALLYFIVRNDADSPQIRAHVFSKSMPLHIILKAGMAR